MAAFTEEQIKILEAAFDHVWARLEHLHTDLYNSAAHTTTIGRALLSRGVITLKQIEAQEQAGGWPPTLPQTDTETKARPTETQTMRQFLRGDLSALRSVLEEEERIREKRAGDGTTR